MFKVFSFICSLLFIQRILCNISSNDEKYSNTDPNSVSTVHSIYARLKSNVTIPCLPNRSLQSFSDVYWTGPLFNKTKLEENRSISSANSVLTTNYVNISKISASDSGKYNCSIRDGNLTLISTSLLIVLDTPRPPNHISIRSHNASSIQAKWKAKPNSESSLIYNISVFKRLALVNSKSVSDTLEGITFYELEAFTNYSIRIQAADRLGFGTEIFSEQKCTAAGKPTISPEISILSILNTSVTIVFKTPDLIRDIRNDVCANAYTPSNYLNGPFHGFFMNMTDPKGVVKSISVPFDLKNKTKIHTISDLAPFAQYKLTAYISNGDHFGPASQNITFTTLEGLPYPPIVFVLKQTTSSMKISWQNIDPYNRTIVSHQVKMVQCGNRSNPVLINTTETLYVAMGLQHSTCYWIQVASRTKTGQGNYSALITNFTPCPPIPSPILANLTTIGNDIEMIWTQDLGIESKLFPRGPFFRVCISIMTTMNCSHINPIGENGIYRGKFATPRINVFDIKEVYFGVKSVCLPPEAPLFYATLSNLSNTLTLDTRTLFNKGDMDLDDKAVGAIIGAVFAFIFFVCCLGPFAMLYWPSPCTHKSYQACRMNGGDEEDGMLRLNLVPSMHCFEDSPIEPIHASELAEHVARYHADDDAGYQEEFETIEKSVHGLYSASVAQHGDNMAKNRYSNVFAYDHSRVILKNPHGRKSDYINASYVDGFHRPRAFIAAQGPMASTFDDFWQMVWDENSTVIVMISNFVERGRRKCDQYWPSEGQHTYNSIHVRMLNETILACYVIRMFCVRNVKCKKFTKERIVYHYQYTDWRDFDVPPSPLPVLVFIKKTVKDWTPSSGPIIVHCSAGVGRTGTYICIESLIRQLEAENQVNIRGFLEHIRRQRMKLVQTEQQYAFIHDALREYALCPEHEVLSSGFAAYVQCLRKVEPCGLTGIQKQFAICTETILREYEFTEAKKPCNIEKNRSEIIPSNDSSRRVILPSEPGVEGSSYINASIVQGYRSLQEFIITQHPLESTEADFWKMVWDKNSSLVFVLSSEEMPIFWPLDAQEARVIGWLRVGFCGSIQVSENLIHCEFLLSSSREDYALTCHLWRVLSWPPHTPISNTDACKDFLKLQSYLVFDHTSTAGGSTIVVDDFGWNRAGIFCALNVLINQFTLSGTIDVYFIFKMLHLQRPHIFSSADDLNFIYSLMEQFLVDIQRDDNSESYATGYANIGVFNATLSSNQFIGVNKKPLRIPVTAKSDSSVKTSLLPLLETSEIPEEEEEEERLEELQEEDEEEGRQSNFIITSPTSILHNETDGDVFELQSLVKTSTVNGTCLPPLPCQTPPPPPLSWPSSGASSPINGDRLPSPNPSPRHIVTNTPTKHNILDETELAMTV